MAEVYLARDGTLERDVALKVLHEQYAKDEEFVERFKNEAQSAAALSHPNIVPVYDRGEPETGASGDPSTYYIAMEYVSGGTLKEYIESKGPLEANTAAAVAEQIAGALDAAHDKGVVHRDIKPQNVLVTETGDVKVADFGIARAASAASATGSSQKSQKSLILGTASYMAPEQALGEPATPRSDLYSLGVVLYEMLTAQTPHEADTPIGIAMKHVNAPPRPPHEANSGIPEAMSALVMKLLSKDPAERHGSAAELEEDLRRVRQRLSPAAANLAGFAEAEGGTDPAEGGLSASRPVPVRAVRRRRRKLIPLVAALALLGGITSLAFWQNPDEDRVIGSLEGTPGEAGLGEVRGTLTELTEAGGALLGPEGTQEAQVPGVEGLTEEEARGRLAAAGFGAEVRTRASSGEDAGRVIEQSAPGGSSAEQGSRVLLAVGEGPRQAEVPALAGLGYQEAENTLEEAELTAGGRYEIPSASVPVGAIAEQGIPAGDAVKPGTAVNLTVSSGSASTDSFGQGSAQQVPAQQGTFPGGNGGDSGGSGGSVEEGSSDPWSAPYGDDEKEWSTDARSPAAAPTTQPTTQDPNYLQEPSSPPPYQGPQVANPPARGGSSGMAGSPPPQGIEPEGEQAPTTESIEEPSPAAPETPPPPPEPMQPSFLGEDQYDA
jgi:serine/threonine-protein kinase